MKKNGGRMLALLVLQLLWPGNPHAGEAVAPRFDEEREKQEQIYQSRGEQRPDGYVVDRTLSAYMDALSTEFDRSLANLGPQDRWLDIGAGAGQAILDYFSPEYDRTHFESGGRLRRKAQAVAISIEDRRTTPWNQMAASLTANQMQYFFNRRFREYSQEDLGKFRVITDVIGAFSYTENISLFMEKVLGILELNGSFFTLLQDVKSDAGTNKPYYAGAPYLTGITNADGMEVSVCSWLKSISCVEVSCELKMRWKPPIESYGVRKVCNNVTVPALEAVHFEAGTPPERRFQSTRR